MKIIVLQRHERCRRVIQIQAIMANADSAEKIVFTGSPNEVLDLIKDGQPAILVTGQVLSMGIFGTELAAQIKKINPRTFVVMYSVLPERNEYIDVVVKKQGRGVLAKLLVQDFDGLDFDKIGEIFEEARY